MLRGSDRFLPPQVTVPAAAKPFAMRAMALAWSVIICGGLAYFIVIGLTHH